MNQSRTIVRTYGLWFLDMVCITASYLIATVIRYAGRNDYGNRTLHFMVCLIFLLYCTVYTFFIDWNRDILKRGYFQELFEIAKFLFSMLLVSLAVVFFARWSYILSRGVILNFIWMSYGLLFVTHLLFKKGMHALLKSDKLASRVIVISEHGRMEEALKNLSDQLEGYRIVAAAYMDPAKSRRSDFLQKAFPDIHFYEGGANLTGEMITVPFDEVFIDAPDTSISQIQPLIEDFEEMGVVCHYNLALPDIGETSNRFSHFGDYMVISYTRFNSSYKRMLIKRVMDIIGGLVGSVFTLILMLVLGIAIKIDSPGPILFSQIRVGKNGRRFRIYKFRSMYQDAEERLKELQGQNEMKGLMFKMEKDPRVTRVGRFIRKTSLDEFPQFFNVLKGDMSLVGTRPPTEQEFEQYNAHYRRRISMTPGMTGLWQVSGRSDIEDFDEVVRLDLKYIDNWSLHLDFKIILQTIGVVLFRRGAK